MREVFAFAQCRLSQFAYSFLPSRPHWSVSMGCPSAAPPEILSHTVSHMICVDFCLSLDHLSIPKILLLQCDPEGEIVRYATQSREPKRYYRFEHIQNSPKKINRPELMTQFLFHERITTGVRNGERILYTVGNL